MYDQGAKKVSFTARHLGRLRLPCTSPRVVLISPLPPPPPQKKKIDEQN